MLDNAMSWLQKHIAVICIAFGLFSAIFVMFSWALGYYLNALYGYKFDIGSCWQGFTAMGVGLVGLFKWLTDSRYNSEEKENPK